MNIADVKANLSAALHGGTLNKVRNIEMLLERAANTLLSKVDPIETMRLAALSSVVHDDEYNYALPSDFKDIIDLFPEDSRNSGDKASRRPAAPFDLQKMLRDQAISIEGSEGSKIARINWRTRKGKVLNTMDSVTANGTWAAVGSATGVSADSIFKVSGNASIKFTHIASGDGVSNSTMTAVSLSTENGVADVFAPMYFSTVPTSVTAIWGNDFTTKYLTSVAQTTQADGTAFRVGWNILKFPWSTATPTGTVTATTINSFKLTVAGTALGIIRVDNIIFSIGRNFDIKYYSKYILKNTAGAWISRTTSDDDIIVLDNDAINIFHLEALILAAWQIEGSDSTFDINNARRELNGDPNSPDPVLRKGLYAQYRKRYPSQARKSVATYSSGPRLQRGITGKRW